MENDEEKNINLIIKNDHTSTSVFKLEYIEQNVNNNIEYQKWKEIMLIKFGNNAKQYKCNKDKILFYSTYNVCLNEYYYYKCKCPICNNYICYFCSFNDNDMFKKCCINNCFYKSFFYYGPTSINESLEKSALFMLIPGLNIFAIDMFFFVLFYPLGEK